MRVRLQIVLFISLIFSVLSNGFLTTALAQNAQVKAVLDSQQILIGDQVNLDLSVELSDGVTVAWPVFADTITGQLEIVNRSMPDTMKKETGETVYHQRLVLTSFDTGFIVVPAIKFYFNDDSTQVLSTDPLVIFVSDIPVEMEADIKDIKEPYDVPFNWKKWLLRALLVFAVLALLIGAYLWWKKRQKQPEEVVARPKPKRPAHEIALEKLEALRQKKLWQNEQVKEYYIELTDIIREYIEFRFDVLALEMTTDEIMAALHMKAIDKQTLQELRKMLHLADLAKFAKYRPMPNENELCFDAAKQFVAKTLVMPLDDSPEQNA